MKFVLCYDVGEEKRRGKIRRASKARGQHHQLSIFLIEADDISEILQAVEKLIKEEYDRLLIAEISGDILYLGKPYEEINWSI